MWRLLVILTAVAAAFGADDPWAKVRDLKSGTELRVFKKGSAQPVVAKMGDLTDENLVVIIKTEQVAIPKAQIDRIDYRPPANRMTLRSDHKTTEPDTTPGPPGHGSRTPGTSSSSGVSFGSRPDFETIYRRQATPPPAAKESGVKKQDR